jgi:hypothetical protein
VQLLLVPAQESTQPLLQSLPLLLLMFLLLLQQLLILPLAFGSL